MRLRLIQTKPPVPVAVTGKRILRGCQISGDVGSSAYPKPKQYVRLWTLRDCNRRSDHPATRGTVLFVHVCGQLSWSPCILLRLTVTLHIIATAVTDIYHCQTLNVELHHTIATRQRYFQMLVEAGRWEPVL